ncbi:MAG: UpxY family transcription antiterminator [Lewinellaceae bacterium]|nr:UpxY family transcription antiterminator [Lewinellaceae bacterium]
MSTTEPRWFAVYTRYKREKQVVKFLLERGVHAYLPLQTFTRYYTRKVKKVDLPLISCYIFVKITREEYVPVLETPDVLHFVKLRRNLIAIPEREIQILRAITGEGVEVEVTPLAATIGDEVEICQGRLYGLRGKLVEQHNDKNVVIELEQLGYALRIQVDPQALRKVAHGSESDGGDGLFERYRV